MDTDTSGDKSGAGRPLVLQEAERRALILQAAEQVFDRLGYGDATMEEIARECGMAKKSVYKYFPDKPSLFGALIDSHEVLHDGLANRPRNETSRSERLRSILLEVSSFIMSPRQIKLTRLVIAEARKSPELAERFYRECVGKTLAMFARELRQDGDIGAPPSQDAERMADMFLAATLGALQLKALMLNPDAETLRKELEIRVDIASTMMVDALERLSPADRQGPRT